MIFNEASILKSSSWCWPKMAKQLAIENGMCRVLRFAIAGNVKVPKDSGAYFKTSFSTLSPSISPEKHDKWNVNFSLNKRQLRHFPSFPSLL
jgi:hypothetical protein